MPRLSRRLSRTTIVVLAIAAVLAGCRPAPSNGRYPPGALVKISPSCYVVREVAGGLVSMLIAARKAGVKLAPETTSHLAPDQPQPPRIESCYRTYDMQVWWRNYYCSIGQCQLAAVPGTSRHGFGKAVDFEDQLGELSFSSPGYAWLKAHAHEFGFFHPSWAEPGQSTSEAWHWEAGTPR
jgi:hypothetical protein